VARNGVQRSHHLAALIAQLSLGDLLIRQTVDIRAKPPGLDRRSMGERSERDVSAHEPVPSNGSQLADRDPVSRHVEAVSRILHRVADALRYRGLIDTSVVIDLERVAPDALPSEIAIAAVTLAELAAGPEPLA